MEGKQELFKFFSIVEFLSLDLTMLFYGIIQLYYFVRVYILNPIRNMYIYWNNLSAAVIRHKRKTFCPLSPYEDKIDQQVIFSLSYIYIYIFPRVHDDGKIYANGLIKP